MASATSVPCADYLQILKMSILVDQALIRHRGRAWCHMVAESVEELHSFAAKLGLKREWFQHRTLYPHYDLTESVRRKAIALGAVESDKRRVVECAKRLRLQLNEAARARATV